LGEKLYEAGIEARLDQWFVQPGESFTGFMEQEVAAADFVLIICTPSYADKSNRRQGGVGYEQQIVSGRLMSGTARSKFIPILRKGELDANINEVSDLDHESSMNHERNHTQGGQMACCGLRAAVVRYPQSRFCHLCGLFA